MDSEDKAALAAIGTATSVSAAAGSVTVLVTTTKILGLTVATSTVAVPVAVVGGALTYGGYKLLKMLRANPKKDDSALLHQ